MTQPGLKLSVVSRHPDFNGRTFRPYQLGNEQCIGTYGNEEFELRLENDGVRRELIVSIDGANLLTAKKAVLEDRKNRFIIESHRTATIKAWVESREGGAKLVFVAPKDGVAAHTIEDESQRGLISVACFKECCVPPPRPFTRGGGATRGLEGVSRGMSNEGLLGGSAVGAGAYTQQHIGTAQGLTQPEYEGVVYVRHMWWDELVAKLHAAGVTPPSNEPPPGFFPPERMADLGTTPRVGQPARMNEEYPRFL